MKTGVLRLDIGVPATLSLTGFLSKILDLFLEREFGHAAKKLLIGVG